MKKLQQILIKMKFFACSELPSPNKKLDIPTGNILTNINKIKLFLELPKYYWNRQFHLRRITLSKNLAYIQEIFELPIPCAVLALLNFLRIYVLPIEMYFAFPPKFRMATADSTFQAKYYPRKGLQGVHYAWAAGDLGALKDGPARRSIPARAA